jgi:hypothetical protein
MMSRPTSLSPQTSSGSQARAFSMKIWKPVLIGLPSFFAANLLGIYNNFF